MLKKFVSSFCILSTNSKSSWVKISPLHDTLYKKRKCAKSLAAIITNHILPHYLIIISIKRYLFYDGHNLYPMANNHNSKEG